MKNIIIINANGEVLVSSVNDGTNTLYINEVEIDHSQWIGSGSYTATVEGHNITIAKAAEYTGNIQLIRISEYNYKLVRLRSFSSVLDVYQDGISVVGSDGIARVNAGSATGDLTYVHVQNTAADTWNITHNLNKYPSVSIVDSAGNDVIGNCNYVNANEVVLTFSGAFSGKAFLN